jgi:hypothetical protein
LQEITPAGFSAEEYAAMKASLESSANSLQAIYAMEGELSKTQSRELALSNQVEDAEIAAEQLYVEYYTSDYQLRVTEGDHDTVSRIVNSLDATNGEWPDPHWSFPFYQSFDELLASEALMDGHDALPIQGLPPHL